MARRRARELAFRALFQSERGGAPLSEVWKQVREDVPDDHEFESVYGDVLDEPALAFAGELLDAVEVHRAEIDEQIEALVEGWSFPQMAQTDLNLLRLAVAEMRYFRDIPPEVTIEMAVRNAKKYGGADSGRFVNGVLARFYRDRSAAVG